jgi:hypothetical protein
MAGDNGKPAAPLFFHADDRRANLLIGRGPHALEQSLAARVAGVFREAEMGQGRFLLGIYPVPFSCLDFSLTTGLLFKAQVAK